MTGHLECASGVFQTEYEDGSRTVVNYNAKLVEIGGVSIPARGYVLIAPDGSHETHSFSQTNGLR